jgi:hypothetical protein
MLLGRKTWQSSLFPREHSQTCCLKLSSHRAELYLVILLVILTSLEFGDQLHGLRTLVSIKNRLLAAVGPRFDLSGSATNYPNGNLVGD